MSPDFDRPTRVLTYAVAAAILLAAVAAVAALRRRPVTAATPPPVRLSAPAIVDAPPPPDPHVLRVCADPNNLPFTNRQEAGFENAIGQIVARDLGRRVEVLLGAAAARVHPHDIEGRLLRRRPWCPRALRDGSPHQAVLPIDVRFFVTRRGRAARLRSLDDPRLKRIRIGVEMTGEDYENPPALQALASRHIIDNVRGYLVYGDYSTPNPPRQVIDAVSDGEVDVAIAWGPLAGYFAQQSSVPLDVSPVLPARADPALPFAFDISMGVRRGDTALHDALDRVLASRAPEIRQILRRFGVPLLARRAE